MTWLLHFVALCALLACIACGKTSSADTNGPPGEQVRSSKPRLVAQVSNEELRALTADNAAFALDVLHAEAKQNDFFFSPHSMSIALAMTYAGARERTAEQMATALHFTLPEARLHPDFGALDFDLIQRSNRLAENGEPFALRIVNALFGQTGYAFRDPFLDLLAEHYGAGLSLLDFRANSEASRTAINRWVSDQTNQRIPELLQAGVVTPATVLVLTNAIWFKASWKERFEPSATSSAPFTRLDGSVTRAPTMHQSKEHRYADGTDFKAVELRYVGDDTSMLVILPNAGSFERFTAALDAARLQQIVGALGTRMVDVALPKFELRTALPAKAVLKKLGMTDAFEGGLADFSRMDGTRSLFVQDVVHEAFVKVDENGTEAAAATAVVVGRVSAPERATFIADRPFLVVIRDDVTGAVLFLGQVMNPAGGSSL